MIQKLPLLLLAAIAVPAFAEEQTLFNGKDLSNWEGNPALWSVKDGVIHGETKPTVDNPKRGDLKHNTFLVWKGGVVNDFELRLKYRISSDSGNSGIQYRSAVLQQGEDGPIVSGYQADFEAGKTYSGILYEERGRGILAKRGEQVRVKPDAENATKHKVEVTGSVGVSQEIQDGIHPKDWNEYVVIAKGNHLEHFINGRKTVDVTDEHEKGAKEGILAFQIHAGPPMVVEFKDVVLKPLK
jgi:hypothetical protein